MNITIIGISDMFARAFANWAVDGGHNVTVVGPGIAKPEAFMRDIGATNALGRNEPLRDKMIFLALPYNCVLDVLGSYESTEFEGKIVVDLTIPIDFEAFEPIHPQAGSVAQEISNAVGARVVKAFNQKFAGALAATQSIGQMQEMLLAGDDADAKRVVAKLFNEGGLRPVDVGPLRRAREIEAFGYLYVALRQPNLFKLV